ncbi:MAG TPA: DinB family protein [Candidatus Polarisedimenticolia bacterium]|nr:DinB family protein [Candidatus Polarisedimenticolia bacterium]
MDYKDFFIKYWEKEAPATRKVIGRIPQDRCEYRADPKARTAREMAWLIVREEAALAEGLEKGVFDWKEIPAPATVREIVAEYDRQHDAVTKRLRAVPGARWEEQLPFLFNGQEVMREIGYDMAWGFLLDQIHHRGQLSTYLRPMGAKVPAIYGPSADES